MREAQSPSTAFIIEVYQLWNPLFNSCSMDTRRVSSLFPTIHNNAKMSKAPLNTAMDSTTETLENPYSQFQAACSKIYIELVDMELTVQAMVSRLESSASEYKVIAPSEVSQEVKQGLKLYYDNGGQKTWVLSEALANGQPITSQQIDQMVSFFNDASAKRNQPEWSDYNAPFQPLICWKLMGGDFGSLWSRTTKELYVSIKKQLSQQ